jgi:rRNA maturation endonuclease Nob1
VRDACVSRDEDGETRNLDLRSILDQVFQNLKLKWRESKYERVEEVRESASLETSEMARDLLLPLAPSPFANAPF